MQKTNYLKIWAFFFLYTLSISVVIEFIVLPYIFPFLHYGRGLLSTSYDSIFFHNTSLAILDKMKTYGWSAWELRPEGQGPVGISSMLYYLTIPDPRIFIPISAFLHASSATILVKLLNNILGNQTKAIICALPFLIFPSNLQWTAQLHKDSYSIMGALLILYSVVSLSNLEELNKKNWYIVLFFSAIFYIVGIFLIWFVRPYMLVMLRFILSIILPAIFIIYIARIFEKRVSLLKTFFIISLQIALFVILLKAPAMSWAKSPRLYYAPPAQAIESAGRAVQNKKVIKVDYIEDSWKKSSIVPSSIDSKCYMLAQLRKGFRTTDTEAKSNIDLDIGFNSVVSMIKYIPRAAQIVFLSPFPNQWFASGSCMAGSIMRKESSIEMIISYICMIFLFYSIRLWYKRVDFWIILVFCISMMLFYGLVFCNIGSLYRLRYPFMTTLIAFGLAGFIDFLENFKLHRKGEKSL